MHAYVRAVLPLGAFAAIVLCNGCGGGGGGTPKAQAATNVAPVVPANRAPTIAGDAPAQVRVGAEYLFQPISADADGDALAFTATNLPPWAEFDAANGRISGRPSLSDVGEYEGITITVADASHQTHTAEFAIVVQGPANGVAQLKWASPVSKVDGSPLDDLAGYRILYGHAEDELTQSVLLMSPAATSFEFTTLDTGTWYFAIVAVNANGLEGPPTPLAMKSI